MNLVDVYLQIANLSLEDV